MFDYDFGGTEYRDAGEAFRCLECGTRGEAEDLAEDPWSECPAPEDWHEPPPFVPEEAPIEAQPDENEGAEWREEVAPDGNELPPFDPVGKPIQSQPDENEVREWREGVA